MRFSTVFVALAAPLLVASSALPRTDGDEQCEVRDQQCCNSTQTANSSLVTTLLGLLGVAGADLTGLVGVTCSPITVIGASGTSCTAQPVCCSNNNFNGVIALGCTPININI